MLPAVIVLLAAFYPRFGFIVRRVEGDVEEHREQIVNAFRSAGFELRREEDDALFFRAKGPLHRLLLLGEDASRAKQPFGQEEIRQFARRLSALGPKTVIVTGIEEEEKIWNIGFDAGTQQFFAVSTQRRGAGYSGTGDILSSVICGCMVRGEGAQAALERAAKLLEISIAEAVADGTDPNEGIAFEHHLRLLMD